MNGSTAHFENARQKKVTIIGAGNTGCALAADLTQRGFAVCLYAHPEHAGRLEGIAARGKMSYDGIIQGECMPELLTTHEGAALGYASEVILALPSYAQEDMFARLAPHIQNHHNIINLNGNFSSYILAGMVGDRQPTIVETNCAPHASRACCNGDVDILGVKTFLPIAPVRAHISNASKSAITAVLPSRLEWQPDVVAVSLQAYNGVLHPAPMVLNAGRIEPGLAAFRFYAQGISPAVGSMIEQIDRERLTIARLYGHHHLRTTLDALNGIYNEEGMASLSQFARCAKVYQEIDAPTDINSRYISEDVPFVLVPWYLLGKRMGFEATAMKSIIDISSIMHQKDYMQTGRTLEKMRLPAQHNEALYVPAAVETVVMPA